MKMRFGGTRHTSTSCCVEGCEIFSMRSSTSSRVHVNPSVRITYMSGAWSSDECSPTADASEIDPPLPVPSGALCVDGKRALDTDATAPSSLNPAPSYAGAVSRSSAAACLAASDHERDGSGAVADWEPRVVVPSAPATLYTAEDGSCASAVPAGFVASAASSAACASCSCFRSVARASSSSSQEPRRLRTRRSANSRTNASCARLPKSQLRLSSARASSTFMPREMRQQLTMLPVRPMPALQCTNIGRLLSSSATSMNRSTSSNEGGSMSVTGR